MPSSPGEEGASQQDARAPGSFASVFKGLTGATKLTKLPGGGPVPPVQPAELFVSAQVAQQLKASAPITHGVPQQHVQALNQLRNGATVSERVAAAAALRQAVIDYPLNPVLDIWYAAKDLVDSTNSEGTRAAGWELLTACVRHPSSTGLERKEFFQTISSNTSPQDFKFQLAALAELTRNGRNISGFDYEVFPLLSTWLMQAFNAVKSARSAAKRSGLRFKGKTILLPEEENFINLFASIRDLIKFNISAANEEAVESLVDSLLKICMTASVEDDLRACIDVLESIVTYGAIPQTKHKNCVHVLSSIHSLVPSLEKASWHTFRVLCRSHNGAATVRQLIEVLSTTPEREEKQETKKQNVRELRGALSILQKLVAKSSEKGYPAIPFTLLVDGLSKAVDSTSSWRVQLDVLRLLNVLFEDEGTQVNTILSDEDWAPLLQVAVACAGIAIGQNSTREEVVKSPNAREEFLTPEITITDEVLKLVSRIEMLINTSVTPLLQREDCIDFLAKLHQLLPDSAALAVLDYYKEFRCCFPSDADWETKLESVLHDFFSDKGRSTEVRSRALQIVTELYDMIELIDDHIEPGFVPELIRRLLVGVSEETDVLLLEELMAFSCAVATTANYELFRTIVDTLRGVIGGERLRTPMEPETTSSASSSTQDTTRGLQSTTPSNVVAKGYVRLFVNVMGHDSAKAIHLFETLVVMSKLETCEVDARLTAMKMLFRLRADWANRIFLLYDTESIPMAAKLVRTEAALVRKQAEEAAQGSRHSKTDGVGPVRPSRGTSFSQLHSSDRLQATARSSSGVRPLQAHNQPMWILPDPEALPPNTSQLASPVLFSTSPEPGTASEDQAAATDVCVLRTSLWLEAVLELLKEGSDWEVYSFMLVHLPSQLSNHALFKMAIPQMQELRRLVCEQLRNNSLPEPPSTHGLRRADVAICYFQSLTMILSYHHHFQKAEEDDIVRTFVQGIAHWERSAKICIHALSICCHELPSSTSKMLVTMLSKMSQIITQPYVAMHILEFLTCLSRLPQLYANFHQEEFRIVFGICFRYLQYAREKRQVHKPYTQAETQASEAGHPDIRPIPNATDDLPQYVYALAYHVIVYWFLALKLPDRAAHVGWIAKNLFMDADGSQASDEQAQTTIDFMQRVTYADVVESAADPLFTSERFGPINKRRWLVGNSIVTIEQATASGWAQITKRHPSGTSSYMIRENYQQPPPHQKGLGDLGRDEDAALANDILPNHLLVSLLTSLPQGHDHTRPIPLPDDDAVQRAIRMFDHNSTVDGHKVGVIYIGENQTHETEILANVSGSSDYVEFLNRLGTLTKLKGASFNTQGLDRQYGTDGEYTFCWRDRVTEMVFHVTTQMPTNIEHDPGCTLKKRHIGNDFVNIIFNDSGSPFKFDTFPSDFNYVNIVITPESRGSFVATRQQAASGVQQTSFYKVQVMSKPGFPEISPASDTKIVSLKALPAFIRLLALNASVFCLVWSTRDSGGDNISPWRNRLREIIRLREKFGLKSATAQPQHDTLRVGNAMRDSFSTLRRSSVATFFSNNSEQPPQHVSQRSSLASTTNSDTAELNNASAVESVVDSVDFSKWA
ncbi:tuberin [Microdochium trichocladiopsis]|uniref:Tuberin n=1 Tax=Microdochium trichocladiopsis TaxID=1682393 RepID=A0A9P8Y909_9PEZI|nr:tuberin [Microdochium trichocladiopsis]KAH7033198.1 tuberin [Microdochium trichocladiopsis]